ncbi:MAG: hypothetical protein L0H31_15180, partial [Nocardioidaceae bacterium]|nr:hypothetical protein [Nocardioidaceae bacterium]
DFGADARHGGNGGDWSMLMIASLGAMACLFLAFILALRLARTIGLVTSPDPRPRRDPDVPAGGKRAAR